MPRRRDQRPRVLGPTWIPSKQRWRVLVITPDADQSDGGRPARWFDREEDAQEFKDKIALKLHRLATTSVAEALEQYQAYLHEKGTGAISYKETIRRLRLFFTDPELAISRITTERAKGCYEGFRKRQKVRRSKDGTVIADGPISVDYQRSTLINARSFLSWCVAEQKWLAANPLADVKGVGRRKAGKRQHTGNETRKLYSYCLERAQAGDDAALGVLMALLMALRTSDITRRIVRDVDLDGTVLRIYDGKSEKSNEPRDIPHVLRPLLLKLIEGRSPSEPLFKTPYTKSGHHTRRWLEEAMHRFCDALELPYVCPHALKGTAGTILARRGELANKIAEHLSHTEDATTKRHYIAPGAIEAAELERALGVLDKRGEE